MENKYQEALDRLKNNISIHDVVLTYPPVDKTQNDLDTLQELIDNYSKLQKALDKACELLEDGYGNEYANYEYNIDLDTSIEIPESMNSKEWKEWLLKDE